MLEIKNLSKSFDGKILFKNFSYSFSDRGVYAVVGESGIGKTTLLRMIAGLDKDYDGEIVGGGAKKVSFAFQEYRLFPWLSAIDNVIFAISDRKDEAVTKKAYDMLSKLGFNESDMKLTPDELSGGMKQRVSIARAMLFDAPIMLLDEPTKELDSGNADVVRSLILEESEHRLVIVVTHNSEDISLLKANEIIL